MLEWVIGWLAARELAKLGKQMDRDVAASRHELHGAKCEIAELLKDEPAERWAAYGLNKDRVLRDCRIQSRVSSRAVVTIENVT